MSNRKSVIGTTSAAIEAFEARLGLQLPPSVRTWLLENNGTGDIFWIPDEREPRTLTGGILDETEQLRSYVGDCLDADPSTVEHLVPIASVGDGDTWCLDLASAEASGEAPVVRWSHETG